AQAQPLQLIPYTTLFRSGAGNTIYEPDYDVFFVGTTVTIEPGTSANWTRTPRYNPLVLQIVSPAGNGLGEEVIAEVVGNCEGLPDRKSTRLNSSHVKTSY